MKKTLIYIGITLLAAASCSRDVDDVIVPGTGEIVATISNQAPTRTALTSALSVVWQSGDKVAIFASDYPTGANYTTQNNLTSTAIFTPDSEVLVEGSVLYAVYPSSAVAGANISSGSLEVDFSALGSASYIKTLTENTDVAALPLYASSTSNAFTFENLFGGIELNISGYQGYSIDVKSVSVEAIAGEQISGKGSIDLSTGVLSLSKNVASATSKVVCSDVSINTAGDPTASVSFVVFLPAVKYESGLRFTITDSQGRVFVKETAGEYTVTAGQIAKFKSLPLTLYYGKENCYKVSGATTISIDAAPYYTFSDKFVRDGSPLLTTAGKSTFSAKSANVLWQNPDSSAEGQEVVSSVSLTGETLSVSTTGVKGNAVVTINDESGILWSWHIWVTDGEDQTYGDGSVMMDRNLGATSVTPKDQNAYGLFYQWGRKDPLPRKLGVDHPSTSKSGSVPGYGSFSSSDMSSTLKDASTGTIAYTASHPSELIYSAANKACWHNVPVSNFWGLNGSEQVKTVYDPCPEGYRIPGSSVYEYLVGLPENASNSTSCNVNYGYMFKVAEGLTSYYPMGGVMGPVNTSENYSSGAVGYMMMMEYRGFAWINGSVGTKGSAFYFNKDDVVMKPDTYGMENARAARCIKM